MYCSTKCRREYQNSERRKANGRIPRVGKSKSSVKQGVTMEALSPASWAHWCFTNFELDAGQQQLVMMGLEFLTVARDKDEPFKERNTAAGRFQAILHQLNLPKLEDPVEEAAPIEPIAPTKRDDPRLKVVG